MLVTAPSHQFFYLRCRRSGPVFPLTVRWPLCHPAHPRVPVSVSGLLSRDLLLRGLLGSWPLCAVEWGPFQGPLREAATLGVRGTGGHCPWSGYLNPARHPVSSPGPADMGGVRTFLPQEKVETGFFET